MRTAFKRIFRRKRDKKKGPGSKESTDDTTPDEPASAPVSLFQPKQQGYFQNNIASPVASEPGRPTAFDNSIQQKGKSTTSSSIIAPIREEFDQLSVTSSQLSPLSTKEIKKSTRTIPSDKMKVPLFEEKDDSNVVVNEPSAIANNYESIPVLEQTKLPRGGVSVETKAVGRVQYGIPPETIKDSMKLGIPVPQVYIVPVDRFCRELGPALGVNLAEFEFPGYFNFFVCKKKCMLVVDSDDAEENIRRVFSETLLGPAQFRREENPITYEEEDFAPDFPREAIPNLQKELEYFRIMPGGHELTCETLLSFTHFENKADGHDNLGIPPAGVEGEEAHDEDKDEEGDEDANGGHGDEEKEPTRVPTDADTLEKMEKKTKWTYSKARFMGDVAVVWPFHATPEQIKNRTVPRVEIFKMPGGTEYIVHDIDVNNHIIGKARILGHVKVSEGMSVDGFGGHNFMDDVHKKPSEIMSVPKGMPPPSFYPPSFGVTVLGNSHGFDASGSVSGYVLWINGRGVMIDPPPYSSATLEREGIRPRMIVAIILTHCHADHDAGAFQKVLAGQPVVVITTPTIYKSFIRKYAALSALSPALLRHSHRFKPAIIGEPLRFQGATFHFVYSLHAIPCVGFRVEWRGRSMVFTADHMNIPEKIQELQDNGVMTKARADDLRNLPLQETDLLLHESGAPPIHTPLDVLLALPKKVKDRLYVVHSAALPENCELKAAPTGTKGTLRLDQMPRSSGSRSSRVGRTSLEDLEESSALSGSLVQHDDSFMWNGHSEYETINEVSESSFTDPRSFSTSFANITVSPKGKGSRSSFMDMPQPPLVSLRPASSTDAWFILNLLSAVPFLSSLSYSYTMELLETAKVDAYAKNDIIVHASRRSHVLCVVWEGTCAERLAQTAFQKRTSSGSIEAVTDDSISHHKCVWHAGDWTGPIALQPERRLSGESRSSSNHDIVAVSKEGAKVITIEFSNLHSILKTGSRLYHRYLERKAHQERVRMDASQSLSERQSEATPTEQMFEEAIQTLNVLELLNCNSALRKLTAVQKRHLECLAEGPISYQPGERLWRGGTPVEKAFLIVAGTASFVPKRRNAGSAAVAHMKESEKDKDKVGDPSVGDSMRADAAKAMKELGMKHGNDDGSMSSAESSDVKASPKAPNTSGQIQFDTIFNKSGGTHDTVSELHDYAKLSRGLQKRADYILTNEGSVASGLSGDESDVDSMEFDNHSEHDNTLNEDGEPSSRSRRTARRRSSRARFANKVLGRLYSRRAFTGGLVFSRGHFLGDVSKMVAGLLSNDGTEADDDYGHSYGFGDKSESQTDNVLETITELIINEQEGDHQVVHSSTLTAGKEGCVVLVFSKSALIPFMDEFPGLLLSLLGTQVVV